MRPSSSDSGSIVFICSGRLRDEARDDSDVDRFFDHEKGKLGIFQLIDLKELAARVLGCKAEIITRASLHPVLRERIDVSALRVP
jgi:predicted nucleotidyltransferase